MSRKLPSPFAAFGIFSLSQWEREGGAQRRRGEDTQGQEGFTLIEVMVSLLIFGMIALAGIAILSFSIRAQAATGAKLDDIGAIDRTMSTLGADLAQAQARPSRDERGTPRPAFAGEGGSAVAPMLSLVRGGWTNIDAVPRATAQKVVWRLDGHVLVRQAYPMIDGAAPLAPAAMMARVKSVALRYRYAGAWTGRWTGAAGPPLPQAMAVDIVRDDGTLFRQLFLVSTGYDPVPTPAATPHAP
ncbi:type II secretion system minor pseudopilin GspJ [Sphingomonas bacterium]|uniref:type II secretion system minor pseudopilin GspJ n=1 Tax=Sphingomonas bacterium TaxID=1895847 RepID=UPI0015776923|nr:type II secretion system minor pseudopilin GspJ [Sphingomonas bacterium]